jgi:hypothetical protein
MIAQEQAFLAARAEFEQLLEYVGKAGDRGEAMHKVEGNLWDGLLKVGLAMLNGYVATQGDGDMGESLSLGDGRKLRRMAEQHSRRYVSVFGELEIRRAVYGKRKKQKFEAVPLDARLELPEGDFSYLLQDWDQAHCVEQAFDKASDSVARMLKLKQSVRSLEHMNQDMASGVEAFLESQKPPPRAQEGELMVVMSDHKGIPMRRGSEDARPADPKHLQKGEKKNKKQMACVGAAYTVDRHIRTVEQVMNEVLRREVEAVRPKPQHKRLRAELTREVNGELVDGRDTVFGWLSRQIEQRAPRESKPFVFLSDGERTLQDCAQEYFGESWWIPILDLMHVLERLWDAAHCFHSEGSEPARAFVEDRLERLLKGQVDCVIRGLRQMATKRRLKGNRAKTIAQVTQYYENNRERMQYDHYLRCGYPIGTGPVEGACRNLIRDRMERTGMHWSVPGAQAMLNLRATYLNGDWDAYCQDRIHRETERLYPYRARFSKAQWHAVQANQRFYSSPAAIMATMSPSISD